MSKKAKEYAKTIMNEGRRGYNIKTEELMQAYADQEVEAFKTKLLKKLSNYSGDRHIPINASKAEQERFVSGLIRGGLIAQEIVKTTKP